jgi:hypothetical protein
LEKASASSADSRVDFEAFLEAAIVFARSAIHRVKTRHEKHKDWNQWWNGLKNDAAVNFFREQRDWILKDASPKIGQKVFLPGIGFNGPQGEAYAPARAAEFYYFENAATPATETVGRHLESLAKLLADAEVRFE